MGVDRCIFRLPAEGADAVVPELGSPGGTDFVAQATVPASERGPVPLSALLWYRAS